MRSIKKSKHAGLKRTPLLRRNVRNAATRHRKRWAVKFRSMDEVQIELDQHDPRKPLPGYLAKFLPNSNDQQTHSALLDEEWDYPSKTEVEVFPKGFGPDWESSGEVFDERPIMLSCGQLCYADTGEIIRRRTIIR